MAVAAPVDVSTIVDDHFAIACVSACTLLRVTTLVQPAQRWTDSAAEAHRALAMQLLDVHIAGGGKKPSGGVQVVVGLLTPGDSGLSPTAVGMAGFDRLETAEAEARDAIGEATGQQHAFELRGNKGTRRRMMLPMPAFRGSRWLAVQIDSPLLNDAPYTNLLTRGLSVFRTGLMSSYEKCVVGFERRESMLLNRLTEPQQAVAKLLLEGHTEAEAGKTLHRSKHTVHDHVKSIYAAFNVQTRVELVLRWTELMTDSAA